MSHNVIYWKGLENANSCCVIVLNKRAAQQVTSICCENELTCKTFLVNQKSFSVVTCARGFLHFVCPIDINSTFNPSNFKAGSALVFTQGYETLLWSRVRTAFALLAPQQETKWCSNVTVTCLATDRQSHASYSRALNSYENSACYINSRV